MRYRGTWNVNLGSELNNPGQQIIDMAVNQPILWKLNLLLAIDSWRGQFQFNQNLHLPSSLKPRLHYTRRDATRRDAIWRDIQVLFTLCATSSRAVKWQQGIWDPEQIKLGNLDGCFDPTWHCVYLTEIPKKITSIRITQPHITWNTNSRRKHRLRVALVPPWCW